MRQIKIALLKKCLLTEILPHQVFRFSSFSTQYTVVEHSGSVRFEQPSSQGKHKGDLFK
jgi:hypothetical protein